MIPTKSTIIVTAVVAALASGSAIAQKTAPNVGKTHRLAATLETVQ